jgi:hypothetical protein
MVLDSKAYKLTGTDIAFQHREILHSLINGDQVICDITFNVVLKNLRIIVDRAWVVTSKFIEMEKKTAGLTDAQKLPFKDEYGKEQLALEQCLESAVSLLDFFFALEIEDYNNVN